MGQTTTSSQIKNTRTIANDKTISIFNFIALGNWILQDNKWSLPIPLNQLNKCPEKTCQYSENQNF